MVHTHAHKVWRTHIHTRTNVHWIHIACTTCYTVRRTVTALHDMACVAMFTKGRGGIGSYGSGNRSSSSSSASFGIGSVCAGGSCGGSCGGSGYPESLCNTLII